MTRLIKYAPLSLVFFCLLFACKSDMENTNEPQPLKLALEQDGILDIADSIFTVFNKLEKKACTLNWLEEYSSAVHFAIQEKYNWDNKSMDLRVYLRSSDSAYVISSSKDGTKSVDEMLPEHLENKLNGTHKCMSREHTQIYYKGYNFRCSKIYKDLEKPMIVEFCFPKRLM